MSNTQTYHEMLRGPIRERMHHPIGFWCEDPDWDEENGRRYALECTVMIRADFALRKNWLGQLLPRKQQFEICEAATTAFFSRPPGTIPFYCDHYGSPPYEFDESIGKFSHYLEHEWEFGDKFEPKPDPLFTPSPTEHPM